MNSYAIMHMDRHVATIRGDGSCTLYFPRFMPYNLYLEGANAGDMDTRVNNLQNFHYWCATRLLTLDRKYAKEIMNSLGLRQAVTDRERAEIAVSYHALCLTDVFWVRPLRENTSWKQINLYDHSLSDAFVDVSLLGWSLTAENAALLDRRDSAGDVSTAGVAPKAWVRREDGFWLLKDGDPGEVEAELMASQIARCFNVPQVLYESKNYQGWQVSASRLMTDKDRSIVPVEFVDVYAANAGTTVESIIADRDLYGFHMMNIVDYLVGNTDRHWGNWGFWVDNHTNKLGKLHPLMDFNKAFHSYDSVDGAKCLTTKDNMSQKEAAILAVKVVGLNQIRALPDNLPGSADLIGMLYKRLDLLHAQENS